MAKANALTVARLTTLPAGKQCDGDLPLNFHPAGTGARWVDTPVGAAGATDIRAKLVCGAARVSLAVERCAANALGVRWPSTECGHVSLKSAPQRAMLRNMVSFRNSSRMRPLKLSTTPFCM